MLKITRSTISGTTTLALSGRVSAEHLPDLRRCLDDTGAGGLVFDLGEVNLVDREVVWFLAECEAHGIRLVRCPAYVLEWMAREK